MAYPTPQFGQNQFFIPIFQHPANQKESESYNNSYNATETNQLHQTSYGEIPFSNLPNIPSNPLSEFLAEFLEKVVELSIHVGHQLYTNSSVIILAAGMAGGVQHFASGLHPLANAALKTGLDGSVAVAKYVGLAFFIKTALTPIHEAFTTRMDERREDINIEKESNSKTSPTTHQHSEPFHYTREGKKDFINSHVVSYLTPMALAWIVAYSQSIPVKLANATLYTMGTFGLMKVLNMGYDYALAALEKRQGRSNAKFF